MSSVQYVIGDVRTPVGDGNKVICHCVNDIGVMGAGVALALLKKWPQVKSEYLAWYRGEKLQFVSGEFSLGHVQFVKVEKDIIVCNLVGQEGIKNVNGVAPIRYESISSGFGRMLRFGEKSRFSVHMPRIGCGLAGGSWEKVEKIILDVFCKNDITVVVYDLP